MTNDVTTPLSLRDILRVLFKRQRPILAMTGVALVTSTLVAFLTPPTYEATSHLLVRRMIEEAEEPSISQGGRVGTTVLRQVSQADEAHTEIALIKSRDLVMKVIEDVGLTREAFDRVVDFRRHVRAAYRWIREQYRTAVDETKYFLRLGTRPTPEVMAERRRDVFVRDVTEALIAEQIPDSDVLRVGFRCSDPALAQRLATSLAEQAITWHIEKYRQSGSVSFLQEQVDNARDQVEEAERELAEARGRLNLIGIDDRRKLLVENQFKARARLNEIRARRSATEAGMGRLEELEATSVLGPVRQQLPTLAAERAALLAEERAVRQQLGVYEKELESLNGNEYEIKGLERKMESRAASYAQLMNALQLARTYEAKQRARIANVVIIQAAAFPLDPVKPRKWFLILVSTGAGLLLAVAWAFAVEFNDSSFGNEAELRANFGVEPLGTIRRMAGPGGRRRGSGRDRTAPLAPSHEVRVDLDGVRSRLLRRVGETASPVVGLASCVGGEGATTALAMLGASLAESGRRVVLVDANPDAGLTRLLGMECVPAPEDATPSSPSPGEAYPTSIKGLLVVPWDGQGRVRLEALDWRPLAEGARARADVVLVDLPPVLGPVQVAPEALAALDGQVLVVAAHRTRREVAERARVEVQRASGRPPLGVILNARQYFIPEFIYRHA